MNSGNFMEAITIVNIVLCVAIVAGIALGVYVGRKNKTLLAENQDWLKR